jgi:hypothetical protein
MKSICIYERNRGLGDCAGPIEKLQVAQKRSAAWKGLEGLKARLEKSGEAPGVCNAHGMRAQENGYILGEATSTKPGKRRARG